MSYRQEEVLQYIKEENIRFIRLAFCDAMGTQKNIAVMSDELPRAFADGISFDASAVSGFSDVAHSDMLLFPDPSTLALLPWRPSDGGVVRMFCRICHPDGTPLESDSRYILSRAVKDARNRDLICNIGAEFEFYLFKTDENGEATKEPYDRGGYMDVSPLDKAENIRRAICLTLHDMGIEPISSHHEEGPGQNEIDFQYSDALHAADNAVTFTGVVRNICAANGLCADFSPKPLEHESGNGLHLHLSLMNKQFEHVSHEAFMAGILDHIREITLFLNPTEQSYLRLGQNKAPKYITWSEQNRSQLIRIPASTDAHKRMELRSADCTTNPYLAYALLIWAGLDGMDRGLTLPEPMDCNLFALPPSAQQNLSLLPQNLAQARQFAAQSPFLHRLLPAQVLQVYGIS